MVPEGSFSQLSWKNDRLPGIEGCLFEGVTNFLTKGGKNDPPGFDLLPEFELRDSD